MHAQSQDQAWRGRRNGASRRRKAHGQQPPNAHARIQLPGCCHGEGKHLLIYSI